MRTILIAILLLAVPGLSQAQTYFNSGGVARTWEWSIAGIYQYKENSAGSGGSTIEIDPALGLGINFAYNVTNKFSVGMDFEWLQPDYKATRVSDTGETLTIDHYYSQFNGRLKGSYFFLDGPVTPYLEGGMGWTYMDSNVADGPPSTGCWWTWYGYVCTNYYNTYSTTEFTYGGAVGVRYEMSNGTLIKLSYNTWVIDAGSDKADPNLAALRLEFGWRF